ncbi:hypothetical protein SAMN06295905_2119 [Devosia lucknowensis]|uniref:Uncharacterized protein n=1 Tax=Devosia lucknowensis TaxID=1096929 RepID=A0A1Y6FG97_9HYPH|nr:hypothetical protein [Devosia lucknowensis]SMQ72631.1 hypothetical protein SAMN06295905_2119 [Devosia lucknowensis]
MRAGLALILGLVLAVTPAFAQGKTKTAPADEAVAALEVCEAFASRDSGALDKAIEAGWDAYDEVSESPFVVQYGAAREMPGIGWADLYVLQEGYPGTEFGYCRIDVTEPKGKGAAAIEAIAGLDRYEGDVTTEGQGTYASLEGTGEGQTLLMTHWDETGFVLQLTKIAPKAAPSEQ